MNWTQRWRDGRHTWRHVHEGGFDPARYEVHPIAEDTPAKAFVVAHHYSAAYPAAHSRYGLYQAGRLVGVLVYGIPAQAKVLTTPFPGLEPYVESVGLARLVLLDEVPANAESWFIARCAEGAAAAGVRGVVSFSDPVPRRVAGTLVFPGHVGIIYQASNAVLCGRSTPRTLNLLPDGRVLSARAMQKVRGLERGHRHVEQLLVDAGASPRRDDESPTEWLTTAMRTVGVTRLRHGGNWRYCFRLGTPAQRRRVELGLPTTTTYPKIVDPERIR